ncbi:MAG: hypothetical protein KDB09_10765 [Acidimicrobiales bacterium]|nr:hypothetical protein [Acidimicrobiales bacterium]
MTLPDLFQEEPMATIRASCDRCGDIEMTSRDLTVRVCRNDGSGTYCFACPLCHERGVREAEPRVVELLVTSGVRLVTWSLPAELSESHHGAPITHDDILDFHALLETEDWMSRLESLTRGVS